MKERKSDRGAEAIDNNLYKGFSNALVDRLLSVNKHKPFGKDGTSKLRQLFVTPDQIQMKQFVKSDLVPSSPEKDIEMPTSLDGMIERTTDALVEGLATAYAIDKVKKDIHGVDGATAENSYFTTLVMERFAWLFALKHREAFEEHPSVINYLQLLEKKLDDETDESLLWFGPKIKLFTNNVLHALNFARHLESLPAAENNELQEARELKRANDQYIINTRTLENYTVKSVIAPSITEGKVEEWYIDDTHFLYKEMEDGNPDVTSLTQYINADNPLAFFVGNIGKFSSTKRIFTDHYQEQGPVKFTTLANDVAPDSLGGFMVKLGNDGKLVTLLGYDLREYVRQGKLDVFAYEQLRAELLVLYTDLVVPEWVPDLSDQEIRKSKKQNEPQFIEKDNKPNMLDIVLARTKVFTVMKDDIVKELNDELQDNLTVSEQTQGARELRVHTVEGHTRRIRSTHRASEEARQNALKEKGIVLPEFGLTYEKRHTRGSLPNDSLGHRVRLRGDTTISAAEVVIDFLERYNDS